MRDPEEIKVNQEARMIPMWSITAATVSFALVEYYLWAVLGNDHHTPPMLFRFYFNLCWGILAALYFILIGYISVDAPRRAMSMRLWVVICFVMPGGIGAVLYFLLRAPSVALCPACGTHIQSDFHYCPQCKCQLVASCSSCFQTVRGTDRFCTRCGHSMEEEQLPARLRQVVG
jgi:uncharacterized MnhB-related membrane protein